MKAIQKELGESTDTKDEISEIEDKIKKINFSDEALEKVKSEIKKLKNMGPMSAEATVIETILTGLHQCHGTKILILKLI